MPSSSLNDLTIKTSRRPHPSSPRATGNAWRVFALAMAMSLAVTGRVTGQNADAKTLKQQASRALRQACHTFHKHIARHGGYVYFHNLDTGERWGEGSAAPDQIWVQPPGTPAVGFAYLAAWRATGDRFYLDAATDAASALIHGQLKSGGWTNAIDFNPRGSRVANYRNGNGKGRNFSTLDDGISQSAIRLLMHVDRAHDLRHKPIHEAVSIALEAVCRAQFPNGGFPQGWDEQRVDPKLVNPIRRASYPKYDWKTEGRVKNYWDMITLNDNVAGDTAAVLIDAYAIYKDAKYFKALTRLGDFLLLAQMPPPQSGWAQQYSYDMHPIWARRFEPPAVATDETQEVLQTLMQIATATTDRKYLRPIPSALAWLKRSTLKDGRLPRYCELRTNRPLYMQRQGKAYSLTYSDARLPDHYGWKISSRVEKITKHYQSLVKQLPARSSAKPPTKPKTVEQLAGERKPPSDQTVRAIIKALDGRGRWVTISKGEKRTGDNRFKQGTRYIASDVFNRNARTLSDYLR